MAHERKVITTQRTVPVEDIFNFHSNEGYAMDRRSALEHDGRLWVAIRDAADHGAFHLRLAQPYGEGRVRLQSSEPHGTLYRPIHPSMTEEDVEGAVYAEDDGTFWRFAHCSPHEQIDFATDVEMYTRGQIQDAINRRLASLGDARDVATQTAGKATVDALTAFSRECGADARRRVLTATLGEFHREPHHDHRRDLAVASIRHVLDAWDTEGQADTDLGRLINARRQRVLEDANVVLQRLTAAYKIEWRPDRVKRLNDAAAASGTDPVDGFEYCYTQSRKAVPITDQADLPDPAWPFDSFPEAGLRRGGRDYYDAEPTANIFLLWVIRFRRPVPKGTAAGASIGTVPWIQEPPYSPLGRRS